MHKGPKIEKKGEKLGHFRVPKTLTFNEKKCTTFLVKMSFICMIMKNHLHIKGWALNLVLIQRPGKLGNGLQSSPDSFPVISESPINGHLHKTSTSTTSTRFSYSLIPSSARPWTSRRGSKEVSRAHLRLSVYWTTIGENSYKTKTPKTQMKSEKISIS